MQLTVISIVVFVPYVAVFASGIERRQALATAVGVRECFDKTYLYTCSSSSYAQNGANIALQCGTDFDVYAENHAGSCARGRDGEFCFQLLTYGEVNFTQVTDCSSVTNSSSCTSSCLSFLRSTVNAVGCCFKSLFNERVSERLIGRDIQISLDVCNVVAPPACDSTVDITAPNDTESCTFDEFWGRTVEWLCSTAVGQPYIDALLENRACTPIARHYANTCGRGVNGKYCLELFRNSVNPFFPTKTAFEQPDLANAITQCANYSSFQSESCPTSCKYALETAINEVCLLHQHFQ